MASQLIKQLRRTIDAKHVEALHALETLADYLEESVTLANGHHKAQKKRPPRAGTGKIRNAVLSVFRQDYCSVRAVAEKTGFEVRQVRGVVNAPALKAKFSRKEVGDVMHYKYKEEAT